MEYEEILKLLEPYKDCYFVYNRRSTDDPDNQKNSLVYQRTRNVAYAKDKGLRIAPITIPGFCKDGIIDEKHSGYKQEIEFTVNEDGMVQHRVFRPRFLMLVRLLKAKAISGVVFFCWDRASRNGQDDILIKKLGQLDSDIRFTDTTYEKTSSGELHQDIDGVFSIHYSRVISEKVRHGQNKLRAEGKVIYNAPLGYLNKGSNYKPLDPDRAPIIKRLFELYATGEWSFAELAKWAREQGLTKRSVRRRRTKEEKENDLDLETIPKISRKVDHRTIELILSSPFYIGKVQIKKGEYIDSTAHQPLIDNALFYEVQNKLRERSRTVHYVDKPFFTYRGLLRCPCGRSYSPYNMKGYNYYRSRCIEGCSNPDVNISEAEVHKLVQGLLDEVHFTEEELAEIAAEAKEELDAIAKERNLKLADLQARERSLIGDLDYLAQNRINLMRTGALTPEAIVAQEALVNASLNEVRAKITAYGESAQEVLQYVITFSQLARNASLFYRYALDGEKREIATAVFTEIVVRDRYIEKYSANDGFEALLSRKRVKGGE